MCTRLERQSKRIQERAQFKAVEKAMVTEYRVEICYVFNAWHCGLIMIQVL